MDLKTTYLGLKLPHPFVAGAGPLSDTVDGARRVEDAGAAAVVLRSLFEEQIVAEGLATHQATEMHANSHGEASSYFPDPEEFILGPDAYLEQLRKVKAALSIPVFASLNGTTPGGWLEYAQALEQAGADALELNLYQVPTDPGEPASVLEKRSVQMVREVRARVGIPLAVKLSPFYTALTHFAVQMEAAGADGLVLFNRFFEPDVDIEELEHRPCLDLSSSHELLLRLRWLAILSGRLRLISLAVTGGVHTAADAIKAIMCGASTVQMVSGLLRAGPGRLGALRAEVVEWMEEHEYRSLTQMRGSMDLAHCPDPSALSRANYVRLLQTWTRSLNDPVAG